MKSVQDAKNSPYEDTLYFAMENITQHMIEQDMGGDNANGEFARLVEEMHTYPAFASYLLPQTIYLREKPKNLTDPANFIDPADPQSMPMGSGESLNGPSNESLNGSSNELLNGPSNESLNGSSNESLNGSSNESLNGSSNESLNGSSNESLNGSSNGSPIESPNGSIYDSFEKSFGVTFMLYTDDYQDFYPIDLPNMEIGENEITVDLPYIFRTDEVSEGKELTVYDSVDFAYENPTILKIRNFYPSDMPIPDQSIVSTDLLTSDLFRASQASIVRVNENQYNQLQERFEVTESSIKILYIRLNPQSDETERQEFIQALSQKGTVWEMSEVVSRSETTFRIDFFRRFASISFMGIIVCIILLGQILLLINKTLRQQCIFYLVGGERKELIRNTVLTASFPLSAGLITSLIIYGIYRINYVSGKTNAIYYFNVRTTIFPIVLFVLSILIIIGSSYLYLAKLKPLDYLRINRE